MFIGHYGVSLAAKRFAPRASLGALFVGAQLLDVLFAMFVLTGVESLRIVPGFTKMNPYDLYAMPYSHSLVGAVLWSALSALAFAALTKKTIPASKERVAAALVFAIVVFSHFALDVPMHTPDLPLGFGPDSMKIGLGIWNQPDVAVVMELGVLVAGGALYLGSTRAKAGGETATLVTAVILVALAVATPFMPPPGTGPAFAGQALVAYAALAALAEWMDRNRVAVTPAF
jgi:hypothetical protein